MESFDRTDILKCLRYLKELIKRNSLSFNDNILRENRITNPLEKRQLLQYLSEELLNPTNTVAIASSFSPFLLDLLERSCQRSSTKQFSLEHHEQICAACSRLISAFPDAKKFLDKYLLTSPPVFERLIKTKSRSKKNASHCDIALTARRLVEHSPYTYADLWDWSPFLSLLESNDVETRWHAANTVACITKMGGGCRHKFFLSIFSKDDICFHQLRDSKYSDESLLLASDTVKDTTLDSNVGETMLDPDREDMNDQRATESEVVDYHDSVVSVCGVLLPRATMEDQPQTSVPKLVPVQSTKKNLRSLALAVSAGNGVLLEGPVGCGKTALVEHLAGQTGRTIPPAIIKVQLGDQTDSKALLGTYRCTDIPGEFVWQAGALTQAVTNGRWILLEDIDYAPMDVISVLLPLLESRSLCIPGHGNVIKAAPGFQLFATQRLLSSSGGLHRQNVFHGAMLDQLWTRVQVEPMSREELHQVIITLFPKLTTVAKRLLDIFCMLTVGHQTWLDTEPDNDGSPVSVAGPLQPGSSKLELGCHDRRLISTRDLIKWCKRIERDFEVNSSQSANMVFLEALDCFCAALTKPETRLAVAEQIGAKLNITREKARFYCSTYKPNIEEADSTITSGRATLQRKERDSLKMHMASQFAFTRPAAVLVERVACCIAQNEPVLLVGETGTGKTSTIQYLSSLVGQRLKVINMNQQSDSTDLLGGFKPVDLRHIVAPVREAFEGAFRATFSVKQNTKFLGHIQKCFTQRQWRELIQLMIHSQQAAIKRFEKEDKNGDTTNKRDMGGQWRSIGERLHQLQIQIQHSENTLAFTFIEGTLVKALRNGDWILLDEINLATAETLECLSSLLESTEGSVVLMERGDTKPLVRHKDFRLFACMNPATDVGKKELPPGIRNRFTELFVDELEEVSDLKILTKSYLTLLSITEAQVEGIVQFYLSVRKEAIQKLTDGTGHRPHYSLRTLCRALKLASTNHCDSVPRSLYESFCLSFLTQLDRASHPIVEKLVCKHVIGKSNLKSLLGQSIPPPAGVSKYKKLEGYWVAVGEKEEYTPKDYVITPSVKANLRDLVRIVSAGRFPVLIQGETSVGKTSLVNYLAQLTGNHCVRVNNHEHTDLQEYVGFYAADESGKLVFKEGVLVDAMRKGHWIILDELNLAPSDVLEALNRLLDDNRELFIPETQEVVAAHPKFMLFATQNPPGQYGGRKVLSRAFRNRFIELHFDEIPSRELETILHDRCQIPLSYCRKMVATMLELQMRRKGSGVFAGKQGFITLRDLFRWAERYRHASQGDQAFYDWNQHIADEGYILLAGRVRKEEEAETIRQVLEKHVKRVVNPQHLFTLSEHTSSVTRHILEKVMSPTPCPGFSHIVWTYGMRRLAVLVGQALKFGEPVLLVGETGCGKTTICQLFAALSNQKLHAVNCHLHTETSDFLGGLRPVRHHSDETNEESQKLFEWCDGPLILAMRDGAVFLIDEISLADDSVLERLNSVLEPERTLLLAEKGSGEECGDEIAVIKAQEAFRVVSTMNPGGDFGKKELSPALRNRFTEIWCPQNTLRSDLVSIIEHNLSDGVQLCNQEDGSSGIGNAIMDFVEWFSNSEVGRKCTISIRDVLSWVNFINVCCEPPISDPVTPSSDLSPLDPAVAYIHGACMVFIDGLGSGTSSNSTVAPTQARQTCIHWLSQQIKQLTDQEIDLSSLLVTSDLHHNCEVNQGHGGIVCDESRFGIDPFYIERGPSPNPPRGYALDAPTTALNAQRLLRALQLPRAILLEGSPGVGKTSLVSALAKASGHGLVRINLSEQTDITDLFGADLPVEGGEGGQFAWRDGPLLQALKAGHWVVLDELNLASQSVLEGLNACLDHRAEVFVPELGRSFQIQHEKTRLFACQNPLKQGGGRKGLPKSFLNRFTQVYIEPFTTGDLLFITHSMYPMIDRDTLIKMVEFSNRLYRKTMIECRWGQRGGPWEFNLRDLFRWCDLMVHDHGVKGQMDPGLHVGLVYGDRMRTADDKEKIFKLYEVVFSNKEEKLRALPYRSSRQFNITPTHVQIFKLYEVVFSNKEEKLRALPYRSSRQFNITPTHVQVGHSFLIRDSACNETSAFSRVPLQLLHHDLETLESLMKCVQMNWMSILVGPSSSGKTTLVHLLASLTGHRLQVLAMNSAMDTTELLGGFEQADLNRHWESLLSVVDDVSMATIRGLFTSEVPHTKSKAKRIMGILSALKLLPAGREGLNVSLHPTDQRLNLLDQLLAELQKCSEVTEEASDLEKLMETASTFKSKSKLEDHSTPGGGGRFEWVDGLLVHALKNGDWLLIDNVNFCSPSVLDRLNALLEPDGVLTINERGVIDGEIPSITPHPDFRLFLCMDPRHGEISRAMRNRGVEIYMLGEHEGGAYSDQDTRTLLYSLGLTSEDTITTLMHLHQEMRSCLQGSDSARLPSLMLAASMMMQLTRNGLGVRRALREACVEVYVNSQLLVANKQRARETLELCLKGPTDILPTTDDAIPMETGDHPITDACLAPNDADVGSSIIKAHPLTDAKLLSANPVLMSIHRQGAVLLHLMNWKQDSDRILSKELQLQAALLLVLEMASQEDWKLRRDWLKSLGSCSGSMLDIGQVAEDVFHRLVNHAIMEQMEREMKELCSEHQLKQLLIHSPMDVHWNVQLLKLFSVHLQRAVSLDEDENMEVDSQDCMERLKTLATRLFVFVRRALAESILEYQTNPARTTEKKKKMKTKQATVFQLSQALQKGQVSSETLPHPSVAHIVPFFKAWDQFMSDRLAADGPLEEDQAVNILVACIWRDRLWQLCMQPMNESDRFSFGHLALHWDWFLKEAVQTIKSVLNQSSSLPVELHTIMKCLHTSLSQKDTPTTVTLDLNQWEELSNQLGQLLPFQTAHLAETTQRITKLCQAVDVVRQAGGRAVGRRQDAERCVAFMSTSQGMFTCRRLLTCLTEAALQNETELAYDCLAPYEYFFMQHGLLPRNMSLHAEDPNSTPDETNGTFPDGNEMTVWLWPVMEHLALSTSQRVVSQMMLGNLNLKSSTNEGQLMDIDSLLEFICYQVPFSPLLMCPLSTLLVLPHSEIGSVQGHKGVIAEVVAAHLLHMQSNTVAASMDKWLSWKHCTQEDEDEMDAYAVEDNISVKGPASLYSPVQTRCMFELLTDHSPQPAKHPSSTSSTDRRSESGEEQVSDGGKTIPLSSWEAHQSHLEEMARVLWRNAGWMSSKESDFMNSSVNYLMSCALWLLRGISCLLPDEGDRASWLAACVRIQNCFNHDIIHADPLSAYDRLELILDRYSGRNQMDSEALPLVRDEMGEAIRVIGSVSHLVKIFLRDLQKVLETWAGRIPADTMEDFVSDLSIIGTCWIRLGHLQAMLLAPQGPVDPAENHALRLRYIKEEINALEAELEVREISSKFLTGQSLSESDHMTHPRISAMKKRLRSLQEMEAELAKRNAYRPNPPKFDDLIKDIKVHLTTSGSTKTIEDLLSKQVDIFFKIRENSTILMDEHRTWQASQEHFLDRIRREYPAYRDLWYGMSMGVAGVSYGMQLLAHSVQCKHREQYLELPEELDRRLSITNMNELVICIASFPSSQRRSPSWLSLAESLTTESVHSLLQRVWDGWSMGQAKQEHIKHSILKIAFQHAINYTTLHGKLMQPTLDLLHGIMGSFVTHYHQAEEAARQREEEEASMYKYKSRSHGEGITDEEMEERDLRESFPSFEKEFADITAEPTLDDEPQLKDEDDAATSSQASTTKQLDVETMRHLRDTHNEMYMRMVNIEWMRSANGDRSCLHQDVRKVTRLGYSTIIQLASEVLPYMAPSIDKYMIGSHLMKVHDLRVAISMEQSDEKSKPIKKSDNATKPYDIYHDPNIPETIQCIPVLDDFMERIQGLLDEWPEHPTLKQMTMLIKRIKSFSVDSPLMKFVTGLELLLAKSQEWETNASKAVSIQTHLEEITQTIIRWRKLELNCWVAMLDNVTFTHAEGSLKWWFHVYRLIQSYLAESVDGNQTQKPSSGTEHQKPTEELRSDTDTELTVKNEQVDHDGKNEDHMTIQGIVGILQKLIEGANLGEFASRLEMLLAFHSQTVIATQSTKETSELSCILWNMYCYYKQFLPAVNMEIENKRKPIEKELKDFVKIAKWNDISFWAMKQAVEKTHKTLIKFRKKYEVVLQGPAKAVFVDEKIEASKPKHQSETQLPVQAEQWKVLFSDPKYQEYFSKPTDTSGPVPPDTSLVARIPVLFERMKKHCTSLVSKRNYSVMSGTLDEFVGEIVMTVKELQGLEVTKDAEPDKQKSEIRHIHQRKRKALSELFKHLTMIGLSYKKGLLKLNQTEKDQPESFLFLPPVDLQATFKSYDKSCDQSPDQWPVTMSSTCESWVGCHDYFFRSQARRAALRDAVANPAKELGVGNIERVKGFTEHLSDLITSQRKEIATMATNITHLRNVLNELQHLHKNSSSAEPQQSCCLPPQEKSAEWLDLSKVIIDQSLQSVIQFTALLECCPELDKIDGDSRTKILSPVPESKLAKADRCHKGDAVWLEIKNKMSACQDSLEVLKASLDPWAHHVELAKMKGSITLIPWDTIQVLRQCHSTFPKITECLVKTIGAFSLPETGELPQLVQSLVYTTQCIRNWSEEFEMWNQSIGMDSLSKSDPCPDSTSSVSMIDAREKMEETVKCILLGVQSLVKADLTNVINEPSGENGEEKGEENELDLDGLLVKKIVTGLSHDQRLLEVTKVVTCGDDLVSVLRVMREQCCSSTDEHNFNKCCAMATSLIPMMQQYLGLACVFLHHMVAAHRATSKLTSVLLSIFTELASQGFCLPAEYSDEMAGEGATDFEDIEGGGIGDGEGTKDVSDQIENEDQIQDTKTPGDKEKEKEDFSDQPDLKDEEHGIEMTEDFEGKLHDQEPTDGDQDRDEKDEKDEEEIDKQMGDVDGPEADKLDERMWGDEEDEEEEDGDKKNKDKEEEFGDGMDEEESRMVAKEENQGDAEGDDKDQKNEKKDGPEEPPDPNNLEPQDKSEFSDDEVDPRQANNPPEAPVPEELDLPDDLDMDKDEMDEGQEGQEEENPFDIKEEISNDMPKEGQEGDEEEGKEEEKMETGENEGEEEGGKNEEEPVAMEIDEEKQDDKDGDDEGMGEDKKGYEDKDEGDENEENDDVENDQGIDYAPDQSHEAEQPPIGAEAMARSKASKDMVQTLEDENEEKTKEQEQMNEQAGKSGEDQEEDKHKSGTAESRQDQKGHEGSATSEVTTQDQSAKEENSQTKKPSQSDSKRSLGSTQERYNKRLKTVDPNEEMERKDRSQKKENEAEKSDLYEHLTNPESHHDTQTMDAATEEQMKEKESIPTAGEEGDEEVEKEDEDKMKIEEDGKVEEDQKVTDELPSQTITTNSDVGKLEAHPTDTAQDTKDDDHTLEDVEADDDDSMETEGGGEKPTDSTIHTVMENLGQGGGAMGVVMDPEEVEKLRREMEEQLALMNRHGDTEDEEAEKMWQSCESVTSSLARDLCEQLRLVLEPTQASKLRGDFRTGKRLNMRKVIPYIASGFRKDKIWLRRTKPSKRQYQIMLAVDDSSSMADNRSKRLAFESLAVISNALTWLEAGQLAVCSFGESVKLLHPFHEQFSDQSGSRILRQFTFAQKKTKIAQLLKYASASMLTARSMRPPGGASAGHPETSQLLVIVSDGRGLFLEGMDTVKKAVRSARDANIFLMFVVIDNPENKDSILDIRVPIFKQAGAMPEIQSYMEHFPFPFYIILRNINALPETLSDALRQWFELVTAADKG